MQKLIIIFFSTLPLSIFAQSNTNFKTHPGIEKQLNAVFIQKTEKHVNITDSILLLPNIFPEITDDSFQMDSAFLKASYIHKNDTFTFYFSAYRTYESEMAGRIDDVIYVTITQNHKTLLHNFVAYYEEYIESYGEERHSYLVDGNADRIPDIIKAQYVFRSFVEDDEFDCKSCKTFVSKKGKYKENTVKNCRKLLGEYDIPFVKR